MPAIFIPENELFRATEHAGGPWSPEMLQGSATTTSDTAHASLHAWIDLHYQDGRTAKWEPSSFKDDLRILQAFIEVFAIYRVWLLQR